MINLNHLDKTSYNDLRLQILAKVEENQGLSTKAYLDSKGIPTIGIGMNLRSEKPKEAVFEAILGNKESAGDQDAEQIYRNRLTIIFKNSYPQTTAGKANLQSDLNKVMSERAADSRITFVNKRNSFEFTDETEVTDTFNSLADNIYEEAVDTWYGSKIPYSYERLALLSLAYNSPSLLGSKLKAAIEEGNRPEAWYQIRYQTNGGESRGDGIAKRRYYESQIFSLYNDRNSNGVVTDAEARAIDKMQKAHATKIQDYDAEFEENVANANRDYGSVALSGVKVQNLRESLSRSRAYTISQYFSGEDASKINQISFTESAKGVAVASALATDPLVVPLKVKSSATLRQGSALRSNARDQKLETLDENLDYADDDTSYYADDDVVEEDSQKVNSLLIGDSKKDIFYVDTSLLGSDHVVSSVSDGTIIIGGTKLSGKASSAKNPITNEPIDGEWVLQGFNLKKVAGDGGKDDLVIYKSGVSLGESTPKVTVKNYPFSLMKPAFGINLDLKVVGLTSPQTMIAERNVYKVGDSVYSSNDSTGKFFCVAVVSDDVTHYKNYAIRTYDVNGNLVSTQFLTDVVEYETTPSKITSREISPISSGAKSCKLDDGTTAFIYGTREYFLTPPNKFIEGNSYAFLAKFDARGKLISNKMVHQIKTIGSFEQFSRYGYHIPSFVTPNGACFNTPWLSNICGTLNDDELNYVTSTREFNYDGVSQDNSFAILPTGHKVTSSYQGGNDYLRIAIASPVYTPTPNNEKLPNYAIAGDYETDPSLKRLLLSLSREEDVNLKISRNPNSVLSITGLDGLDVATAKAKMSFPVDHHSQIKIHSTTDADYTLEQLLNGEFDFSSSQELPISRPVLRKLFSAQEEDKILKDPRSDPKLVAAIWTRRLGGEEEVNKLMKDSAESARLLRLDNLTNSTDDDYSYGYGDYFDDDDAVSDVEEIDFNNLKTPITVIKLQLNETESQTVILHGVNATEVAKLPEAYFLTQFQITNSPTSNPSKNPSGQPSSNPSSLLTNEPTNDPSQNPSSLPSGEPTSNPSHKPTAGELIMPSGSPTGQPTLQPFSDPSAIPSYRPQAIPSYNPTGKPTGNPTNNPSKDPTSNPSRNSRFPTNIPSYSKDTSDLPTSKPSMEELTNQPSSQPSNQATNQESNFPSLSFPSSQPSKQSPSNVPFVSASPSSDSPITTTLPPTIAGTNQDKDQNHQQTPSATLIGGVVGAVALVGLGIAATVKFLNRKGAPDNRKVYADEGINIDIEGNNRSGGNGR
jgi:GH24 family phage-related lysozyme (muramidase)